MQVKKALVKVEVEEHFLISLWNRSQDKLVAQWSWQYNYTIIPLDHLLRVPPWSCRSS